MSDDIIQAFSSFGSGAGEVAADAGGGLSSGVLAGGDIGAGVLQGATQAGLDAAGSIIPEAATAAGTLSGDAALAGVGAGLGVGDAGVGAGAIGSGPSAAPVGAGVPTAALTPSASGAGLPGAGTPAGGVLGGASASAAPLSAPVSPTSSGVFSGPPEGSTDPIIMAPSTSNISTPMPLQTGAPTPGNGVSGGIIQGGTPVDNPSLPGVPSAAAAAPSAWDKFTGDPSLSSAWGVAKSNPNLLLAGAGLGANLLLGNRALPGENQISSAAGQSQALANQLESYLQTGTLPPGLGAGLSSAGAAAKATIKSRHASSGTSGSSAEEQELAAVDQQISTNGADMALKLFQTGQTESQISSQLYQTILQGAVAQDQELGSAIGKFASTLAGSPTINIGGARV